MIKTDIEAHRCRQLFAQILNDAIELAQGGRGIESAKARRQFEENRAFLTSPASSAWGQSRRAICELAGVDPICFERHVRRKVRLTPVPLPEELVQPRKKVTPNTVADRVEKLVALLHEHPGGLDRHAIAAALSLAVPQAEGAIQMARERGHRIINSNRKFFLKVASDAPLGR